MYTDTIADYLTRVRNASMAGHKVVDIPSSNIKKDITKKLKTLDAKLKINTKQQHEFIIKYMIKKIKYFLKILLIRHLFLHQLY